MNVSVSNSNSKKPPFNVEQVNLGDILSERRLSSHDDGTLTLTARWLVLERQLCRPGGAATATIFNCLLLSYNPKDRSAYHWRLGLRRWIHLSNISVWSIAVESGLSWGDD
jgi:hypothetical protein